MKGDRGNILLTTTIWMTILFIVIGSCLNLAKKQLDLASIKKDASQNYDLARTAIEEQVRIMNQNLVKELPNIIKKVTQYYISQLMQHNYTAFQYKDNQIVVKTDVLKSRINKEITTFIDKNYNNKMNLKYEVKENQQEIGRRRIVRVYTRADQNQFNLKAMVETNTSDGSINGVVDEITLKATLEIKLPNYIENEIIESYVWRDEEDINNIIQFEELEELESCDWSYRNPILITNQNRIDISQYYLEGVGAYPTIIVYNGSEPLNIETSMMSKNQFVGMIVSQVPIELDDSIKIEGIISNLKEGDFTYNIDIIREIKLQEPQIFRKVLDSIGLTNYKNTDDLTVALGKGRLGYAEHSILNICCDDISIEVQSLVKEF